MFLGVCVRVWRAKGGKGGFVLNAVCAARVNGAARIALVLAVTLPYSKAQYAG
jgi:hypothetical protein